MKIFISGHSESLITGGRNEKGVTLQSTEFIDILQLHGFRGHSVPGPDLPVAVRGHSMVYITDFPETIMVIGGSGSTGFTGETYVFKNFGEITEGPLLTVPRYLHASSILRDSVTNMKYVVVTGGYGIIGELDSVEVLKSPNGNEWIEGKFL